MDVLWSINSPRIGEKAPDFDVVTTRGPRTLGDYGGKWLVVFSHPAAFTPVCTSEIIAFAKAYGRFEALGCELLGLSTDSNYAHVAWIRSIGETFGVDIPFPMITDVTMRVARSFGMIQDPASTVAAVRTTVLIDPQSVIRAVLHYPIAAGRSVDEILRLVEALQTCDRHEVATPEGWRPGQPVVVPPPATAEEAVERKAAGDDYVDWYYLRRVL